MTQTTGVNRLHVVDTPTGAAARSNRHLAGETPAIMELGHRPAAEGFELSTASDFSCVYRVR